MAERDKDKVAAATEMGRRLGMTVEVAMDAAKGELLFRIHTPNGVNTAFSVDAAPDKDKAHIDDLLWFIGQTLYQFYFKIEALKPWGWQYSIFGDHWTAIPKDEAELEKQRLVEALGAV